MYSLVYSLPLVQLFSLVARAQSTLDGIDPRDVREEMEHLMTDSSGTNAEGFVAAITPCAKYNTGLAALGEEVTARVGEQTTAQWVRMIFHDFVTADVEAGTGGLDGSIGFESDRSENAGLFVNNSMSFFRADITAYSSVADVIALGVVTSVGTCGGGTDIPLRVGRIDAHEAGPEGVPGETTDLETTLAQFATAGFTQEETIAATACGHSLGRIHYSNFPAIVPESTVTVNNTNGGVGFDSTPAVFDTAVVNEYLTGTGLKGGLLVTSSNVTVQSDLRLYSSDNNVTMQSISTEEAFRSTCYAVFQKMIDTVPSTVTLSDPITPLTWKAVDVVQDITSAGEVTIAGMVRYLYDISTTTAPTTVSYTTTSGSGNSSALTTTTASGTGYGLYGNTSYFDFNTTIPTGTTSLNFGDVTYPINDNIFILSKHSTVDATNLAITLRAAILTSLAGDEGMTGVLYVPTKQQNNYAYAIQNVTVPMTAYGTAGNYTLYESNNTVIDKVSTVIGKVFIGDYASRTVKSDMWVG